MDSPVWIPSGSRFSILHTCEGDHEVTAGSEEAGGCIPGSIASGDAPILVRTLNSQRSQPCPELLQQLTLPCDCPSSITHRDTVAIGDTTSYSISFHPFRACLHQHLAVVG